jgi:hypothetical protein
LHTYGKTPDQLADAGRLMVIMLAEFPFVLVKKSFIQWVKTSSKMPTPSDIISLIEKDNSRLLDYLCHVRNGGNLADFAIDFMIANIGENWRDYV